ncbi:AAA family ATPase [Desulfoscipio sp. XC116]|uniref:AAA family ATPase n=1 Tax=Desulfoscipio sp. XC116 TaxID=3144975 RepID=UPI00325A81F2
MSTLNRFQLIGLYGFRNIDIPIKDNTFIFVGENGLGKTTLLKYMFTVLSGAYFQLPPHEFEKIIVTIDNRDYELSYDEVHTNDNIEFNSQIIRVLPPPIRHELMDLKANRSIVTKQDIIYACQRIGYPAEKILDRLNRQLQTEQASLFDEKQELLTKIPEALDARVLYLPTYRRIEEDLPHVIKGRYSFTKEGNEKRYLYEEYSDIESNSYIELVEFGMQDVKDKIEKRCSELSRFSESRFKDLAYMNLGDVIDKKYLSSNYTTDSITEADIKKFELCLSRNSKEMLSEKQVSTLIKIISKGDFNSEDTHSQILLYYFKNLLLLQSDLENKEQSIINFCNMCNNYFESSDKKVCYDISTFKVQVLKERSHKCDPIDMSDLSSGEKQIVSLFSHLFLAEHKNFFVIIDEPELSLSVLWQKHFLKDIRKSALCMGLIAATHSPFIYDNDLLEYTHSLAECIEEVE